MTTLHTPKPGKSVSESHRSELGSSNTPVLIRLPYLGDERAEVPQPELAALSRAPDYGLESNSRTQISPVAAPQPPAPLSSRTKGSKPSRGRDKRGGMWKVFKRWSRGKLPRPVIQGVMGVAMISFCVLAYLLLFGRGPQERPIANGDLPADETLRGFDSGPPPLGRALDLPGSPYLPDSPYLSLETDTSNSGEAPESSPLVASADPPAESKTSGPQTEVTGKETADPAESQLSEEIAATDVPLHAGAATEQSPPPTPVAESSAAEAVVVKYPKTDPTTFQYPPEYHRHLLPRAATATNGGPSSWPAGAPENVWPPSTARLQPQIDPPPVR